MNFSFKKTVFLFLFVAIALVSSRINFSQLVGSNAQYFTFFQFFGPTAAAFLGPTIGVASILFAQLIDLILSGKAIDPINLLRLSPMLFAALYFASFGKKNFTSRIGIIIPIVCIALFVIHPVAGQVWYYSLFWTIPIISLLVGKNLFLRSLGATFTAHAIGSVIWLYTIPMTAQQWAMLITIVPVERGLFALGISVSFIVFNNLLSFIEARAKTGVLNTEKNYLLKL